LRHLHERDCRSHLWLVGQKGLGAESIVRAIHELDLSGFVHLTGFIPLDDLLAFYRLCDAFVLPSLYEGFGLPVLEALAGGAPSAVSRIPALAEILGDAGLLFDPTSVESIADALLCILSDSQYARELSRLARLRASAFSWEETAHKTLAVYESVAA
jgi:glycosyltransferase involved in cell wall biosynthesis